MFKIDFIFFKQLSIFDREKRSYRGPTSGSYSCDFVNLIDLYGAISIYV